MLLTRRWLPFLGLCLGAVFFATLALLLIPNRIDNVGALENTAATVIPSSAGSEPATTRTTPQPALDTARTQIVNGTSVLGSPSPARAVAAPIPRKGFSPPLERPDPPPSYSRLAPPGAFATPDQPAPPLNPADFPPLPPNRQAEIENGAEPPGPDVPPLPPSDP